MLNHKFSEAPHYVVDLESLGTEPDAVILRVGICVVSKVDSMWGFGRVLDMDLRKTVHEQIIEGRTCTRSTLDWWRKPEQEGALGGLTDHTFDAPSSAVNAKTIIAQGLSDPQGPYLWGMGSTFDCSILQSFLGQKMPIPFYRHMCLRTLLEFTDAARVTPERPHVAISDAEAQAKTLIRIFEANNL